MKLYVVGFGCGSRNGMTLEAEQTILQGDLIVGYKTYVDLLKQMFPNKLYLSTGMRQETERVRIALEESKNKNVVLVCSGDPELYGMAGLAYELSAAYPNTDIEVVAGVSAAFSGGAILGSPLTHDFAVISLSDLLTPAEKIENRLKHAAEADFVIVLYNPSSRSRADYLSRACDLILQYRSGDTVCGYVRNIGRDGQACGVMTLNEIRDFQADMFTTVYIGNTETSVINGKMVTPRGYRHV